MTDALPNPQDQERLKEIAAAETANNRASAEDLAKAINGMKALAVEEGTRNFLLVDGISAAFAMTSSDFMSDALLATIRKDTRHMETGLENLKKEGLKSAEQHVDLFARYSIAGGMRHERFNLEGGTLPERLESCRRAIRSGRFHSIVLSDLSEANHAIPSVERELGTTLQEFAHGGGTIAITTSDASVCVPMLQRVFEVAWEVGGYYTHKATWLPAKGNESIIADTFPGVQVIERGQQPIIITSPITPLSLSPTRPPLLLLADCCTVRRRAC